MPIIKVKDIAYGRLRSPDLDEQEAFLTEFGDIVSFSWVTAIAFVIYNVINREVQPTAEQVQKWYKKIHLVIWPTTLTLAILPFFSGSYGNDNGLYAI